MKLLILKPSSLGDIVHTLIVAQSIKKQRPDAHITWVVRNSFAPILQATGIIDRLITFDRKGGPLAFWHLLKEIHAEHYDASLDMQGLLRTGLMNLAARAPLKLCRRDQREGAQLFANKIVDFPKESRHAVDLLMEFLPPLGLKRIWSPLKLRPSTELPANSILIFPSSRGKWANKEWPHFEKLSDEILKKNIGPIAWASDIPLKVPAGAIDFTGGKISLGGLLPFIAQARIVIGNDAGPTHMAAAMGVPTIGLYGPTDPALAGAYPLDAKTNRNLRATSGKIEEVKVEEVLRCVETLLG